MSTHTLVWLDHQEARVFHVRPGNFDASSVRAPARHVHRHPIGGTAPREHPTDLDYYFQAIARELGCDAEIVVVGPGTAKLHFLRYVQQHQPELSERIVGIETVDHPTAAQLLAYARHYFSNHATA